MSEGWELAAQARREFADVVDGLSPEQINAPSLCEGWSVHDVTGHLATFILLPLPKFMLNMATALGNFDKASTKMAQSLAERPMTELVAALRDNAAKKSALPGFPGELTATDAVVHTQDVRRALDLPGAPSSNLVESALRFLTTDKKANVILKKGSLDGLSFEATDMDWSAGAGAEVKGPAEAILMAMLGRDTTADLTGDGVAVLDARTTT